MAANTKVITVRMSEAERERVQLAAEMAGSSMNQWLLDIIAERIESIDDDDVRRHLEQRLRGFSDDR